MTPIIKKTNGKKRVYKKRILTEAQKEAHRLANHKYENGTRARWYKANPVLYLYNVAKKRAKKFNYPFTINPEDIVVYDICPILHEPLNVLENKARTSMSLDRINNDKGYVPGNVAIISRKGNMLKNNATKEQIRNILAYMEKHSG